MVKAAILAVAAAMLAAWIKSVRAEYSGWILLTAGIFLAAFVLLKLGAVIDGLRILQADLAGFTDYFTILIKIIGITWLSEFSSELCRDAGAGALASQVELFGKLSVLMLCIPVLTALLESVDYFLGG